LRLNKQKDEYAVNSA